MPSYRYANPYQRVDAITPLGDAVTKLAAEYFLGGPSAAEKQQAEADLAYRQAMAGKAVSDMDLNRMKLNAPGELAEAWQQYADPAQRQQGVGGILASGGVDPKDLGGFLAALAGHAPGVSDDAMLRASVGAGKLPTADTAFSIAGQDRISDRNAAEDMRQAMGVQGLRNQGAMDLKLADPVNIMGPNGPMVARTGDAYGQRPVLSLADERGVLLGENFDDLGALDPFQQKALGAAPSQGIKISPDGTVEIGGSPLTKPVETDLQKRVLGEQRLRGLLDYTRGLSGDATNFGFPGFVKGVLQDVNALAGGVATSMGYQSADEAQFDVAGRAARLGISPELLPGVFDPSLPKLHTAADLLVFAAAETLAGQSGRNVSDKDVRMFKGIVGDPREWTMNPQRFAAKLTAIEQILGLNAAVNNQALGAGAVTPGAVPQVVDDAPPPGVDPSDWQYMTPEEKALFR